MYVPTSRVYVTYLWVFCQSQSHIATGSQSVGLSWCRAPSGAHDQIFVYLFNLVKVTVLFTMRGRVCRLSVSHLY
jgi:hypothetical protein